MERWNDGTMERRNDGTKVRMDELLNMVFENLNWQEADQMAICKLQPSSWVEDLKRVTIILQVPRLYHSATLLLNLDV